MRYKISDSEFRIALETVGKIGKNVDHDVVKHYQEETNDYDPSLYSITEIWDEFLSYELHHLLARIGFGKFLEQKHNINSKVRGINEQIDWSSFQNPWNQRLSIQSDELEGDTIVKGIQPHYEWVTLTNKQYRTANPGSLVAAARILFREDKSGSRTDIHQPEIFGIVSEYQVHVGDSVRQIEYNNKDKLDKKLQNTDDYGEFSVYKFNKEIDWMLDYNSPVEAEILGCCQLDEFEQYDGPTPETFSVDYSLPIEKLSHDLDSL